MVGSLFSVLPVDMLLQPRVKVTPKRGEEGDAKKGRRKKNPTASTKRGATKGPRKGRKKETAGDRGSQSSVTEFMGSSNKRKSPGTVSQIVQSTTSGSASQAVSTAEANSMRLSQKENQGTVRRNRGNTGRGRGGGRRRGGDGESGGNVGLRAAGSSVESQEAEGRRSEETGDGMIGGGRRRRGEGDGVQERGRRGRTKEVRVADTTTAKWTPVSSAAREILSDTMITALGSA